MSLNPFMSLQKRDRARRRDDLDGPRPPAFELDMLAFVEAGDGVGLLRVGGLWVADGTVELPDVELVIDRGGERHWLAPLPDPSSSNPRASSAGEVWRGAFTVAAEVLDDPRTELSIAAGEDASTALPRPEEWAAASAEEADRLAHEAAEAQSPVVAELVARLAEVARLDHAAVAQEPVPEPAHQPEPQPAAALEPQRELASQPEPAVALEPQPEPVPQAASAPEPAVAAAPAAAELDRLRADLFEAMSRLERTRAERDEAREELATARDERDETRREVAETHEELAAAREELAAARAELASAREHSSALEQELHARDAVEHDLRNAVASQEAELAAAAAKAAALARAAESVTGTTATPTIVAYERPRAKQLDEDFVARLDRANRASDTAPG